MWCRWCTFSRSYAPPCVRIVSSAKPPGAIAVPPQPFCMTTVLAQTRTLGSQSLPLPKHSCSPRQEISGSEASNYQIIQEHSMGRASMLAKPPFRPYEEHQILEQPNHRVSGMAQIRSEHPIRRHCWLPCQEPRDFCIPRSLGPRPSAGQYLSLLQELARRCCTRLRRFCM